MKSIIKVLFFLVIFIFQCNLDYDQLTSVKEKTKLTNTALKIKQLSNAISKYAKDNKTVPKANNFVSQIDKKMLVPRYINDIPAKDSWGNNLLYFYNKKKPMEYGIASPGRDGIFKGWDQEGLFDTDKLDGFNNDIILINGKFLHYPRTQFDEEEKI